ncbi:Mn-dependent DtxR family transcriptional regulator [Clostridium acetobutylicum]|uniref:Predicted transcriptional regulator of MarR-family n=1 Tax=Clostridium acetobutylicum (strain ATCC 824 / DSM 792 / JCM 1419 / IAM 19013 / LMG 5710 / NBRC 13948 / NRRL B-527 / VKM B-1787 / 2291 / W) TaxID=272562 RepID=Q97GV6_CLOAB|nr:MULTISPECIES: HTH domain-containing protein [Clostridium]AAK80216.1 Predicted transcriptional regulator of MarR-family [Clostridium acetobutylicum ATCC 824]ADZ21311.1 transcriptional regulator of MarR-family [Clostridium acetobutylicum EA 2018]AEI32252.1 MarR family transcriptional regulator [Clostridium acetobutylicum DSM 1731]AWV79360.1 HTH domain-containing protein [Clostridium acetobutylicum]MBC2394669.1 HTH domain-containing protein [Clostridium acetobutylicum]
MDIKETILKILSDSIEPLKTKEVAERAEVDSKEVDKAIKALKAEGKVVSPKRCYYSVEK